MPRALPPLNSLRAFEAAARHLSFTKAADELAVTQAAVSHQVKGLEARLGVKLFKRLTRGLLLTDEGQALAPELREGFERLARALTRVESGSRTGTLSVSLVTTFALAWLAPRLARFQDKHPGIDVRMTTNGRMVDFATEDVDCAIRFGRGPWPSLRVDLLFEEEIAALAAPAIARQITAPADLAKAPMVRVSDDPEDWKTYAAAIGLKDFQPRRGPVFDSTRIAGQAAMSGAGVVLGPPALFPDEIATGKLRLVLPRTVKTGKSWWFVSPAFTAERPKIKIFREWVLAETAALRADQPPSRRSRKAKC